MATFTPKTIEEAQQLYFQALADANSGLRLDKTQGSVVYTLGRAAAAIAVGQDAELKQLANSINLSTAVGSDLDTYSTYGIYRGVATKASGTVLANSLEINQAVSPGTILIDPRTSLQYITTNTTNVTVSYLDTPIKVQSLTAGYDTNLRAGVRLYSQTYPTVSFTVGLQRLEDNSYTGDLTGGRNTEDDESFRNRIATWLLSHSTSSKSIILNRLLSFPGVTKAYTVTSPGGVLELWVDSSTVFNEAQKQELYNYIEPYVAAGIVVALAQLRRLVVDIKLEVTPYKGSDLDALSNRITSVINSYIASLTVAQDLSTERVLKLLSPLAAKVALVTPTRDVRATSGEIIILGQVQVVYPI